MPKDFVSQVLEDRADNESMHATLELVYNDSHFDCLDQATIDAVESYFKDTTPPPSQELLDLDDDKPLLRMPEGWNGNTPNGPWEGD